ncbi:hypothetical protein EOD42_08825 [Rhodovarius crocodyli]|uniref:Peptidoglycan binding-like domain-containing protein n=1 Tax=Rhodovarius crocodyli TaxID=1979269 RepID=A0A437MJS6_9PROT|nr:peptidoglycan-binding protein [Rhodovarius crocodyli]RVT97883.1 hypothetical protein EOD42_08825 [Rhodovarius crocodyli]
MSETVLPGTRVLRVGARGEDVRWVQQRIGGVMIDGVYGPQAAGAVLAWQLKHGLLGDGTVGPRTWLALGAQGVTADPGLKPAPATSGFSIRITPAMVRTGFPKCDAPDVWAGALTGAFARFPAYTRLGAAGVIAKAEIETGGLTRIDENLFYTTEAQVRLMFGSRAGANPGALLRNPKALGDQVYAALGGYEARGGGIVQLTGYDNQLAYASYLGMSLADARAYMRTVPGAALTGPWYIWHFGGLEAANRGDMREVLRIVAGKRTQAALSGIWASIHGDDQMAAFQRWRRILGA